MSSSRTSQNNYGRTVGDVLLLDGTNVNHKLVKDGWCWWYRQYAPGNLYYPRVVQNYQAEVAKKLQSIFLKNLEIDG